MNLKGWICSYRWLPLVLYVSQNWQQKDTLRSRVIVSYRLHSKFLALTFYNLIVIVGLRSYSLSILQFQFLTTVLHSSKFFNSIFKVSHIQLAANWWLDDEFSFWDGIFSGAMVVLGRVTTLKKHLLISSWSSTSLHSKHSIGNRKTCYWTQKILFA